MSSSAPPPRDAAGPSAGPPAPSSPGGAEPETPSGNRRLLATLVVIGLGGIIYFAASVLIPLTLGFLLHLLLKPIVRHLTRWHFPKGPTAVGVGLITIALAVAAMVGMGTTASLFIDDVPALVDRLQTKYESLTESVPAVSGEGDQAGPPSGGEEGAGQAGAHAGGGAAAAGNVPPQASEGKSDKADGEGEGEDGSRDTSGRLLGATPASVATTLFQQGGPVLIGLLITFVSMLFLLVFGDVVLEKLVKLLPQWDEKKEAVETLWELERDVSAYLLMVTAINTGIAVVMFPPLWFLGMPEAWVWALLAGLLNYIPYLGPIVYLLILTPASLISFDSWIYALMPPLAFLVVNTVEAYLVTPTLMGKRFELNPLIVFLWLVLWGWMWGVAGTLLAVPMLLSFRILCFHVPSLGPLGTIIADESARRGQADRAAEAMQGAG